MPKRKRSDLDKAISNALHNTRNKVYRLKRKGATDEELRYIDPRRTDWRASRSGMGGSRTMYDAYRRGELNGRQKYEFLQQLLEFNSRENAYTKTDEGGFVSSFVQKRFYQLQEGINRLRAATLDRIIKGSDGKQQGVYYQYGVDPVPLETLDAWDYTHRVARDLAPLNRTNPFSSAARLARGIKTLRNSTGSMRKVRERSKNWQKVAANKLRDNGNSELAQIVDAMSNAEFLRMTVLSDFNAQMSVFQYVSFWDNEGHQKPSDLDALQDDKSAYLNSLVNAFAPGAQKRAEKKRAKSTRK